MLAEEWPLIVFTLLTQISAGVFFFHGVFVLTTGKINNVPNPGLNISFFTGILGLFFAFFHLGTPLHAVNALNNLASSWMSREILLISLFLFLMFFLLIDKYHWIKLNSILKQGLILLNLIVIVALTYSMIHIYHLPTIASWNNYISWYEFISCTLIPGALLFLLTQRKTISILIMRLTGIFLMVLFLLNIIVSYSSDYIPFLPSLFEMVLNTIAFIFSLIIIFSPANKTELKAFLIWLFIIVLAGETLGRFVFYLGFESAGI